jgi:hypothetical protein
LKSEIRDFQSGGVDLPMIVPVDFLVEDPLALFDFGDVFSDAGANESILEPSIRAFDFAFGLRGAGISDVDVAILEDLFPLGSGLISQETMFSPEGVSSLDKTKNRVRIHVIGVRESMAEDDSLEG